VVLGENMFHPISSLKTALHCWAVLCFGILVGWSASYFYPMAKDAASLKVNIVQIGLLLIGFVPMVVLDIYLAIRTAKQRLGGASKQNSV
jgi:hypothetical protein